MLVEFSVANYRSFASQQRLSLNAGRFKSERIGVVLDTHSRFSPHLLRAAAILGANGAGKSSLIGGIGFLQGFVQTSARSMQLGDAINVEPFKLDEESISKPSEFEITFIFDHVEYTYSVSATASRVTHESLFSRSSSSALKQVFSRHLDGETEVWNLGALPQRQARLWKQSTRPNGLFLSTAVQLNSEQLAKPFEWITQKLRIQGSNDPFSASHTSHLIKDHVKDGCRAEVLNLLQEADLGIKNVVIEREDFDEQVLPSEIPDEIRRRIVDDLKDKRFLSPRFEHVSRERQPILFDYDDESDGTQRLYDMAGPLVSSVRHDYTLIVDELETSLHPYLVRLVVQMFQKPARIESKAQLIFSTHSDGLLDAGLLERDQFWFVEKRRGQSEMIALNDYRPRKGEALRINYLRGRYGGVPSIAQVDR